MKLSNQSNREFLSQIKNFSDFIYAEKNLNKLREIIELVYNIPVKYARIKGYPGTLKIAILIDKKYRDSIFDADPIYDNEDETDITVFLSIQTVIDHLIRLDSQELVDTINTVDEDRDLKMRLDYIEAKVDAIGEAVLEIQNQKCCSKTKKDHEEIIFRQEL